MKILLIAGGNRDKLLRAAQTIDKSTLIITSLSHISEIKSYLIRGETFDRAIIFGRALKEEFNQDYAALEVGVEKFVEEISQRLPRFELVFHCKEEETAFRVINATLSTGNSTVVLRADDGLTLQTLGVLMKTSMNGFRERYATFTMNDIRKKQMEEQRKLVEKQQEEAEEVPEKDDHYTEYIKPTEYDDPFGPDGVEDPFGSSNEDPFGESTSNTSDDPFGESGADPFGSSTEGESEDPFGESNVKESDPFDSLSSMGSDPFGDPFATGEAEDSFVKNEGFDPFGSNENETAEYDPFGDNTEESVDSSGTEENKETEVSEGFEGNEGFDPFGATDSVEETTADPFEVTSEFGGSSTYEEEETASKKQVEISKSFFVKEDKEDEEVDTPKEEKEPEFNRPSADPFEVSTEDKNDPFEETSELEADPFMGATESESSEEDPFATESTNNMEEDPFMGASTEQVAEDPFKPSVNDFEQPAEDPFAGGTQENTPEIDELFTGNNNKKRSLPDDNAPVENNNQQRRENKPKTKGKSKPQNVGVNNSKLEILKQKLSVFKRTGAILTVTGGPASGKTVISANLANILCNMGYKVLIIDMDTSGKGQSYINIENYETLNGGDTKVSNVKQAFKSTGDSLGRFIHILRPGYHILGSTLRADKENPLDALENRNINRQMHDLQTSYNFIIIDIPFEALCSKFSDIVTQSDQIVIVEQLNNYGMMNLMLDMMNIEDEQTIDEMFNRSKLVLNMENNCVSIFGKKVKTPTEALRAIDMRVTELIGGSLDLSFEDMEVADLIKYNTDIEHYWFNKKFYSDSVEGKALFTNLLIRLFDAEK